MRNAVIPETKEDIKPTLDEVENVNAHQKSLENKRNEKLTKDLMYGDKAYKRTVRDTITERDSKYARLHSFAGNRDVKMHWDCNSQCIKDQVFEIRVGEERAFISAVELQKYLRWV